MRRLTPGTLTIGILAILIGLVGAYAVRSALMEEKVVVEPPETISVPIATLDLPADRVIAEGDIASISTTREALRQQNIPLNQVMMKPEQIVGRRVRVPVKQGQPFLTTAMYLDGTGPDPLAKLQPGYRAVSLQVAVAPGGLIKSGSFVDVLFRTKARDEADGKPAIPEMTVTLLKHVEILDISEGTGLSRDSGFGRNLPVVTLAVPAEEAGIVQAVEGRGEFSLVMRPLSGDMPGPPPAREEKVTIEDVLSIAPPPPPIQTVIYRRTDRQVNTFVNGKLADQKKGGCKTCGKKKPDAIPFTPIPDANMNSAPPAPSHPSHHSAPTPAVRNSTQPSRGGV